MPCKRLALLSAFLPCCGAVIAAPSLIVVNAKNFTADPRPRAEAVATEQGRLSAVGGDADIRAMAGPGTRIIDAGRRLATPGLIEAHVHVGWNLPSPPVPKPGLPFLYSTAEQALARRYSRPTPIRC